MFTKNNVKQIKKSENKQKLYVWKILGKNKKRTMYKNQMKEAMICFFLDAGRNLQSSTPPNMAAKGFYEGKKSNLWR